MLKKICHLLIIAIFLSSSVFGLEQSPPVEGWPRLIKQNDDQLVIYQPQINSWDDYEHMSMVAAINFTEAGNKEGLFGALYAETDTETNHDTRLVLFKNIQLTKVHFPNINEKKRARLEKKIRNMVKPRDRIPISLDRVLAALERSNIQKRTVEVNLDPPPIFYSDTDAIQVVFLGEPKFEPLESTSLQYAINTNWDIFLRMKSSTYYLRNNNYWMKATNLFEGPWEPAGSLPADFLKLPNDENWKEVKKNIPGKRESEIPKVFISDRPSELIVTKGTPTSTPIPGTQLLFITNTESDLFLHSGEDQYYFLTAGRWFRSKTIQGPWSAATMDLPADFVKIPSNHKKAHVLASVPGTSEAEAAVLLASIPQKATVNRDKTTVKVVYENDPEFVIIEGTSVYYAVNTPYSVFKVDEKYYLCHKGVWFYSYSSTGTWMVATRVPKSIYTIPPTHPKHNVTYVYIYDSTPDTVVVGYTSGYSGSYVAATGVVMFGLGYWLAHEDDWHHHHYSHYHGHYYSYGGAVRYDYYHGGYYNSASYYGPHGGVGRAAYDPSTGTYARGAYRSGPQGSAFAAQAYNPYTDRYAARAGASNAYGSWGRTVVAEGDKWAQGGHRSNWKGTVAGIETSEGAAVIGGKSNLTGNRAVVGKDKYGDVYVGRDGNVYKREGEGSWSKNSNGKWESFDTSKARSSAESRAKSYNQDRAGSVDRSKFDSYDRSSRSSLSNEQKDKLRSATPSRSARQSERSSKSIGEARSSYSSQARSSRNTTRQLERDFSSRRTGESRTRNYQNARSSGSGSRSYSGRSSSGGSSGRSGGGRSGGGRSR